MRNNIVIASNVVIIYNYFYFFDGRVTDCVLLFTILLIIIIKLYFNTNKSVLAGSQCNCRSIVITDCRSPRPVCVTIRAAL